MMEIGRFVGVLFGTVAGIILGVALVDITNKLRECRLAHPGTSCELVAMPIKTADRVTP